MFFGREKELQLLKENFQAKEFQFTVIYGRRRVGKTTLISEYIKDKPAIYFQATQGTKKSNLEKVSRSFAKFEGKSAENAMIAQNFDDLFAQLTEISKNKQIVFVIDEFPYLAQSYPEISSVIQYFIDHKWKENTKLHLILSGSSMSFMEHQVLGYKSPLFGRRTSQIKLLPFTFSETKQFFPKMEAETLAGIFAITGGIPQYLQYIHEDYSLEENIKKAFLSKEAPLFEEPSNLLKQELREPAIYNTILDHLANGKTKISEIAGNGEISTSRVSQRLTNMIELGVVEKVIPIGELKKKAIYRIKDHLFRFWYRFIYMNQDYIEIDQIDELLDYIMKYFSEFMGAVFEEISIQWLHLQMKQKKIDKTIATLGNWWGTNKEQKSQEEIDIIGFDLTKQDMLIGECKWKNQPQDIMVLKKLKERSNLFVALNKRLYVFAKKSFKERAREYARENNIYLITYSEMYDDF